MTQQTIHRIHDRLHRAFTITVLLTPVLVGLTYLQPTLAPIVGIIVAATLTPYLLWGILYPDTRY